MSTGNEDIFEMPHESGSSKTQVVVFPPALLETFGIVCSTEDLLHSTSPSLTIIDKKLAKTKSKLKKSDSLQKKKLETNESVKKTRKKKPEKEPNNYKSSAATANTSTENEAFCYKSENKDYSKIADVKMKFSDSTNEKEHNINLTNISSILETSNLLKESVLLSPSFADNVHLEGEKIFVHDIEPICEKTHLKNKMYLTAANKSEHSKIPLENHDETLPSPPNNNKESRKPINDFTAANKKKTNKPKQHALSDVFTSMPNNISSFGECPEKNVISEEKNKKSNGKIITNLIQPHKLKNNFPEKYSNNMYESIDIVNESNLLELYDTAPIRNIDDEITQLLQQNNHDFSINFHENVQDSCKTKKYINALSAKITSSKVGPDSSFDKGSKITHSSPKINDASINISDENNLYLSKVDMETNTSSNTVKLPKAEHLLSHSKCSLMTQLSPKNIVVSLTYEKKVRETDTIKTQVKTFDGKAISPKNPEISPCNIVPKKIQSSTDNIITSDGKVWDSIKVNAENKILNSKVISPKAENVSSHDKDYCKNICLIQSGSQLNKKEKKDTNKLSTNLTVINPKYFLIFPKGKESLEIVNQEILSQNCLSHKADTNQYLEEYNREYGSKATQQENDENTENADNMILKQQLLAKTTIFTQSTEKNQLHMCVTPAETTSKCVNVNSPKIQNETLKKLETHIDKVKPLQNENETILRNQKFLDSKDITRTKSTIHFNDEKMHHLTIHSNVMQDSTLSNNENLNTNFKGAQEKSADINFIPQLQDEAQIFSSPEKLFSGHLSQLDVYDTAKENKSVDTIANYLKIALRRKSENSHYQYKKKLLQNYSKENFSKGDSHNIHGVEKPGGTVNYNNPSLRKPIITYTHKRFNESNKLKSSNCQNISQFYCKSNERIDCEASLETHTMNFELPINDSKISFFSELELSNSDENIVHGNDYNECKDLTVCDKSSSNIINCFDSTEFLTEMVDCNTTPLSCDSPIYKQIPNMIADENVELFQNILPIFSTNKTNSTLFLNDLPRPEDCNNADINLFGLSLETIDDFDTLINDDQCTIDVLENIINADNNDTVQVENSKCNKSLEQKGASFVVNKCHEQNTNNKTTEVDNTNLVHKFKPCIITSPQKTVDNANNQSKTELHIIERFLLLQQELKSSNYCENQSFASKNKIEFQEIVNCKDSLSHREIRKDMARKSSNVESHYKDSNVEECENTIKELKEDALTDILTVGSSTLNVELVKQTNTIHSKNKRRKRTSEISTGKNEDFRKSRRTGSNNKNKSNDTSKKEKCKPKNMDLKLVNKEYNAKEDKSEIEKNELSDQIMNTEKENAAISVKCSVCRWTGNKLEWLDHIYKEHQYLAWTHHELPLDNEKSENSSLNNDIKKEINSVNSILNIDKQEERNYDDLTVNNNIQEEINNGTSKQNKTIQQEMNNGNCTLNNEMQQKNNNNNTTLNTTTQEEVNDGNSILNIEMQEEIISDNSTPINIIQSEINNSDTTVKNTIHAEVNDGVSTLNIVMQEEINNGNSTLNNTKEQEVNDIQQEINDGNTSLNNSIQEKVNDGNSTLNNDLQKETNNDNKLSIICGVCQWEGNGESWLQHLHREHNYIAWKQNETPLVFDDENQVLDHLKSLIQQSKILECNKCGVKRKYAKGFLTHMNVCIGHKQDDSIAQTSFEDNESSGTSTLNNNTKGRMSNATIETQQEIHINNELSIMCGVCQWKGNEDSWRQHLYEQHNYMAWKRNDTPLNFDDKNQLLEHLKILLRKLKILECNKCGVKRKMAKGFWTHMQACKGHQTDDSSEQTSSKDDGNNDDSTLNNETQQEINIGNEISIQCGVCRWEGNADSWFDHVFEEHNYIAWKRNETPLDENDEDTLINHFKQILQKQAKLVCNNCGIERKYPKTFWNHWRNCKRLQQTNLDTSQCMQAETSVNESENNKEIAAKRRRTSSSNDDDNVCLKKLKETEKAVQCGRCNEQVDGWKWKDHLMQHKYIAWIKGELPINEDLKSDVRAQLHRALAKHKALTCKFCRSSLTSVVGFQYHIERCEEKDENNETTKRYVRKSEIVLPTSQVPTTDPVKCAVCSEEMPKVKWQSHLEKNHYNLAWFEGGVPFDIMNHNACHLILNELVKKRGKLVCVKCGLTRISGAGFYTHVLTCGKTTQEIDALKENCVVCGRRFLPVALSAHILTHRNTVEVSDKDDTLELSNEGGRRKAAVAAKANIEKITSELIQDKKVCTCGYIADTAEELGFHKCSESANQSPDVSDEERWWTSESDESESEVDELVSDDNAEQAASDEEAGDDENSSSVKQSDDKTKSLAIFEKAPYRVGADDAIISSEPYKKYAQDFCESHFTSTELLFPYLKCNDFEPTLEPELSQYMPPLTQSCQFYRQMAKDNLNLKWKSFDLFESINDKNAGQTFFVGGPVTSLSFAPPRDRMSCEPRQHYIAVTCQRDVEFRGMHNAQLYEHSDLIQIWSFGNFESNNTATLVLGIAHDNGTVWSIDWCPSGGWEEMELGMECKSERLKRLGLMAVACSDGTVYVYAVCHPHQLPKRDLPIYKTKPVLELKLCSDGYDRQLYQATAVHWSMERGHKLISVGYSNGTVGLYDITTESPLLKIVKDETVIINPYFDNALADSCILKLLIYPQQSPTGDVCLGAWSTKSGELSLRAASGTAPVLHQRFLVGGAHFAPYWPNLQLQSNETPDGGFEVNWLPSYSAAYRRVCGEAPFAACVHSRRLALASQGGQIILARNVIPGSDTTKKSLLRTFVTVPLVKGLKAMSGEQSKSKTYEEVCKNYGLLSIHDKRHRENLSPVDYPLCGLTAITFSPCRCHHSRLVFAGVAGLVHVTRL